VRLLIVRLSALGDIVHALPVLAVLQERLPQARIDWLVEQAYEPILALADGVRRVVVRAKAGARAGDAVFGGGIGYLEAIRFLRAQRYDLALDLQGLVKSAMWARLSGARRVVGFDRLHLREPAAAWLYSSLVVPPGGVHVIEKNLSLIRAVCGLAASAEPPAPATSAGAYLASIRFPLRVSESPAIARAIADAGGPGRYVVLNPGAAWPNKRWPPERFAALAAALKSRRGLSSLVTWGPSERSLADAIVRGSSGAASAAPPTSVEDLAALMRSAGLVVSGDTGPLHIAAAMGTRVVGLYGPTWPARNGPWDPRDIVISRADACRCHHKRQCQIGAPCIETIALEEVVRAAQARL
jgi:heptosyltransferase-1